MIDECRVARLLAGARGAKSADVDAVVDVLMRVQQLAVDHAGTIREIDVNPRVVTPDGAVALDALVVCD